MTTVGQRCVFTIFIAAVLQPLQVATEAAEQAKPLLDFDMTKAVLRQVISFIQRQQEIEITRLQEQKFEQRLQEADEQVGPGEYKTEAQSGTSSSGVENSTEDLFYLAVVFGIAVFFGLLVFAVKKSEKSANKATKKSQNIKSPSALLQSDDELATDSSMVSSSPGGGAPPPPDCEIFVICDEQSPVPPFRQSNPGKLYPQLDKKSVAGAANDDAVEKLTNTLMEQLEPVQLDSPNNASVVVRETTDKIVQTDKPRQKRQRQRHEVNAAEGRRQQRREEQRRREEEAARAERKRSQKLRFEVLI